MPEELDTLAKRLTWARTRKGLCQMELGELTGSSQSAIQKIENGKSLRPRKIETIAEVVGINPAWLMFGEPWAKPKRPKT
ncbi:helix-turn-helix domain-containing protein [Solemya velesiana gill symbiont]|uniref:helix-turn-helix domain-containing protein n=1 Tax=Solemya velesiana gill symbiont TaxID=1918948 RepID=UPI000995FE0A|nr:helix-turn-helix transcriptional regulator [Solemya velesiana gill symbiont]